jgi:hypothetical protein
MKKMIGTKYKEILRETLAEYNRKGNYVRIYPAAGSDVYDKFFADQRPFNRYIYHILFKNYFGI